MKIYLSSITYKVLTELHKRKPDQQPNGLLSFGVEKNDDLLIMGKMRHLVESLILDSGTFSLHTADKAKYEGYITLKGYGDYLSVSADKYDFYFNFDRNFTINGFPENLECLMELERRGFNPVPVVHDYYREEIDYYIDQGYELLALGSVMEPGSNDFLRKKDDIYHAVERLIKHNIKIHVFASSTYDMLHDIPVYSSDASSWAQYASIGRIQWWNPEKEGDDKTDLIRMRDFTDMKEDRSYFFDEYPFKVQLEEYLDSYGIVYEDLMGEDLHLYRQVVNCLYYMDLEQKLTELHRKQGFPF